jgi:hypothetical protein
LSGIVLWDDLENRTYDPKASEILDPYSRPLNETAAIFHFTAE